MYLWYSLLVYYPGDFNSVLFDSVRFMRWRFPFKAWFPYRRKRRGRPSIDGDMTAMHRGRYQKLNWVELFESRLGHRRYYGDVGDINKKRSHIIVSVPAASPIHWLGRVPVTYDDMETRLNTQRTECRMVKNWVLCSEDLKRAFFFTRTSDNQRAFDIWAFYKVDSAVVIFSLNTSYISLNILDQTEWIHECFLI